MATAKLQFDEQVKVLKGQIQEISIANVKLKQTNDQLVAKKEELRQQAEKNQIENARLTQELNEKDMALQELRDQNTALQTKLAENQKEIEELNGTILSKESALEQENVELKNELKALEDTKKN